MSFQPTPSVEDLSAIADQVWSSYLDPEGINPLLPIELAPPEAQAGTADVCASVSITGSWHGHVVVKCSEATARYAAAALLAMEVAEVSEDDVIDALGELANIVGGNVKSTLPSQCAVSLPHVMTGAGVVSKYPAATQVCELSAVWHDEPVSISVWQSRSDLVEVGAQ